MTRLLVVMLVAVLAVFGGTPGAGAQIPPVDDVTDTVEETVEQVEEVVEETVDDGEQTIEDTIESTEQTTEAVAGTADPISHTVGGNAEDGTGTATDTVGQSSGGSPSPGATEPRGRRSGRSRTQGSPNGTAGAGVASARVTRVVSETGGASSGALVYVPLLVRFTNDADGDGSYSTSEAAPMPGADVPLQVRLENAGSNELAILAIRDASPTPIRSGDDAACRDLAGIRLAPGKSTVCRFTATEFAPPEGERVVTVLEVDVAETTDPSAVGTVTDTTVITTGGSVLGLVIRRGLDALATTGAHIAILMAGAVGLAAAGVLFIRLAQRQRRVPDRGFGRLSRAPSLAVARLHRRGHDPLRRRGRGRGRRLVDAASRSGHTSVPARRVASSASPGAGR
ncbi:MAG: hypothetical protein ACRDIZ_03580 [Actinomycetota bacterium]